MIDYRTSLEKVTDAVNELTQPRTHREALNPDQAPISVRGGKPLHGAVITRVASLLDQLEQAVEPSGSTSAGHRVPASTPAARMDAINALLVIDNEVSQQVSVFLDAERPTLTDNLRALVGIAAEVGPLDQKVLARYAKRWHTMAAIVTGWEVPAMTPRGTCPLCSSRGALRVRVEVHVGTGTGLCVECHETWDETTIGLLAEHIRAENREDGQGIEPVEPVASRPCNCSWTQGVCLWCSTLEATA